MRERLIKLVRGYAYGLYRRCVYPAVYVRSGDSWSRRIAFGLLNYQPRLVKLHLNYDCNLSCAGCYCRPAGSIISKKEIFSFIDELGSGRMARPLRLDILGGEPLLCQYLEDVVAYASRDKKIGPVALYTNATLCDEKRSLALKRSGLSIAIVTFHSHQRETHDMITAVPGSWDKTVAGIRALVKAGVRTYTFTIVMPANVDALDQVDSYARQLGAKSIFHRYMPQRVDDPLCVRDLDTYQRSVRWMHAQSIAHRDKVFRLAWWRNKICPAFIGLINIQADGAVTPCPFVKKIVLGNIRMTPLHSIMKTAYVHKALEDFLSVPEECVRCVFKSRCSGGCKASGYEIGCSAVEKDMYCRGPYTSSSLGVAEDCIPYFY